VEPGRVAAADLEAIDRRQRLLHREVAGAGSRAGVTSRQRVDFTSGPQPIATDRPQRVAQRDRRRVCLFQRVDVETALLERGVGVRFNGVEKTNVEEYCVSEGWIRVAAGKAKDRAGNPMTIKLRGKVEPYFREGA
jgi:hypothetical protein